MRIVPLACYTVVSLAIAQGWLKPTAIAQTAGTRDSLYYQHFVDLGNSAEPDVEIEAIGSTADAPPVDEPRPTADATDPTATGFPIPTLLTPETAQTAGPEGEPSAPEAQDPAIEPVEAEPEAIDVEPPDSAVPAPDAPQPEPPEPPPAVSDPEPAPVQFGIPLTPAPESPASESPTDEEPEADEPGQTAFPAPTMTAPDEAPALPDPLLDFPTPAPAAPETPQAAPALPVGELAIQVAEVRVEGGDPALQEVIRAQVQPRPGSMTTEEQLRRDVDALLSTGLFSQVTVRTEAQPTGTVVTYEVEPIVVRSLRITGNRAIDAAIPNQAFAPQVGQPINLELLRQGSEQVNQWYQDNGFTLSRVVSAVPDSEGVLTIALSEVMVNQVNIRYLDRDGSAVDEDGNPIEGRTQEDFVRQVIELQPGQLFSEPTAQADLQRIAGLDLFDSATVDVKAVNDNSVDVTYNLVERLSRRFNLGGGISDEVGLFGSITYEDTNLGGVGNRLSADVRASGRGLEFGTRFTSPYRDFYPDRLGYSFYASSRRSLSVALSDEVRLPNDDRIREQRLRFGASVMRPLGEWDAELGLNYTRITMTDSDGDDFAEDEEGNPITFSDSGSDDLITLLFQASRDRRDNPRNPREGSVLTLSTEQSIPIGNGNIFMNRLQANYAAYLPVDILGNSTPTNPEVLAFNLQGGTILGDAPPYYSFNLGGANSVRGYGEGDVGTGRTYALASVEYRFPIFRPVGAALFADFATDFGTADDVFGEPAEARDKPGTGFGAGAGIRVDSPFGLLRLDFGINDEGESRVHFGFGQRF